MEGGNLGEKAAQEGAKDRGQSHDRAEYSGEAAALARGEEVGDDGKGRDHQGAAAQPLNAPKGDQLDHAAIRRSSGAELTRQAAQGRAQGEDHHAADQNRLSAIEVRQLAIDRHHHGRGQKIGRGHPGIEAEPFQLGGDAGHGGRNDGLVERRQQKHNHQPDQGEATFRIREGGGLRQAMRRLRFDDFISRWRWIFGRTNPR